MKKLLITSVLTLATFWGAEAQAIPTGWTCTGNCGTAAPNGKVSAPPNSPTYDYISTAGAPTSNGLGLGQEINGSLLTSNQFIAQTGDSLKFYFNFVTSDGSGYSDYAWARLLNVNTNAYTYLVTARTSPSGSIIPGTGLPAVDATLTPGSVPIISGGPTWAQLGASSGSCYNQGCGYTGWVLSDYTIKNNATYQLQFGVVNWKDKNYDSGLALSGAALNNHPIDVPEPASLLLVAGGVAGLIGARRRAKKA